MINPLFKTPPPPQPHPYPRQHRGVSQVVLPLPATRLCPPWSELDLSFGTPCKVTSVVPVYATMGLNAASSVGEVEYPAKVPDNRIIDQKVDCRAKVVDHLVICHRKLHRISNPGISPWHSPHASQSPSASSFDETHHALSASMKRGGG